MGQYGKIVTEIYLQYNLRDLPPLVRIPFIILNLSKNSVSRKLYLCLRDIYSETRYSLIFLFDSLTSHFLVHYYELNASFTTNLLLAVLLLFFSVKQTTVN